MFSARGFQLLADANKTSHLLTGYTAVNSGYADPCEEYINISERTLAYRQHEGLESKRVPGEESAHPLHFSFNFIFGKTDAKVVIHDFKRRRSIYVYSARESKSDIFEDERVRRSIAEGPPDDAWTVSSWTLNTSFYPMISEAQSDINKLLTGLGKLQPLPRSGELLEIADRVASQITQREKEDVEAWAERLADDLSKITD